MGERGREIMKIKNNRYFEREEKDR